MDMRSEMSRSKKRQSKGNEFMMKVIGTLALASLVACAPEPLIGADNDTDIPDAVGGTDTGLADTTPPSPDTTPGGSQQFTQIADSIRSGCAISICHGNAAVSPEFFVEGANLATDAQVRAALEGKNAKDGSPLVVPGDSANSYLYTVLTTADPLVLMPPTGALPADQIALFQAWIDGGANY